MCEFWLNNGSFLGQVISKDGVEFDLGKVKGGGKLEEAEKCGRDL